MNRYQRIHVRAGYQAKNGHKAYAIGVPWQIAEALPDGLEFAPELTGAGLLFRPVLNDPPLEVPAWVRGLPA